MTRFQMIMVFGSSNFRHMPRCRTNGRFVCITAWETLVFGFVNPFRSVRRRLVTALQRSPRARIAVDRFDQRGDVLDRCPGHEAVPHVEHVARCTTRFSERGRYGALDARRGSHVEVESDRGTDVRREIARAVVNRGWGLLEMRPMRMSLEEIFLQVTTDETPQAGDSAAAPPQSESGGSVEGRQQ